MEPTAMTKTRLALLGLALLITASLSGSAHAELVFQEVRQQSGLAETGGLRAVYLGRLFASKNTSQMQKVTGMYGGVTIRGATNVALYGGNGTTNFESRLALGEMVDTGMRFTNSNQTSVETIFLPDLPPPSGTLPPFAINDANGLALGDLLRTNGTMDFWLVASSNSTFTAPSSFNAGTITRNGNFLVQFHGTAVPEPSSLILASLAACGLLWRKRRSIRRLPSQMGPPAL
jgi:hypothetical protein